MRPSPAAAAAALLLILATSAALVGCRGDETPTTTTAGNVATALDTTGAARRDSLLDRTFVYVCSGGDVRFVVRVEGATAFVYPAEQQVATRLPRIGSDSSAVRTGTYETADDRLVMMGDSATLRAGGKDYTGCESRPDEALWENARLSGVDFRAVGHGPDWNLDIHDDSLLVFVTDSGRTRLVFPAPAPDIDVRALTGDYRVAQGGRTLAATLHGRACVDDSDGTRFETTVDIRLDSTAYTGCGRAVR